jgi:hypothetical protein
MDKEINSRNYTVDFMRTVGTLLIILAHVESPEWIKALRSFDVILLVMISGMMIKPIYNVAEYIRYILKRVKRLILPTWTLLTFLFISLLAITVLLGKEFPYSLRTIFLTYTLIDGIGYVWIVRIYLMIAFISPILFWFNARMKSDYLFLFVVWFLIFFDYVIYSMNIDSIIVNYVVLYLIPYSIAAMVGLRLSDQQYKFCNLLVLLSFLSFIAIMYVRYKNGCSLYPQSVKYPPRPYYLIYGLLLGTIIYKILIIKKPIREFNIIVWFSMKSFHIYLAHIVVLIMFDFFNLKSQILFLQNWILEYIVICLLSTLAVWGYYILKSCWTKKTNKRCLS